ncbi:MAG TPA: hypothetical protein VGC66_06700 [Pyrinomonadaceae bacterium]
MCKIQVCRPHNSGRIGEETSPKALPSNKRIGGEHKTFDLIFKDNRERETARGASITIKPVSSP